jgi:hypothetical protein
VQGKLEVTTLAGTGTAADKEDDVVETKPFFLLSLDLPPARLFQDAMQEQIIPQVRRSYSSLLVHRPPSSPSSPFVLMILQSSYACIESSRLCGRFALLRYRAKLHPWPVVSLTRCRGSGAQEEALKQPYYLV